MASTCSICLSSLLNPVSIPCGHIHCEKCLHDYIDSTPQIAVTAPCPTCRQPFPIVTPDLSLLPKKYHPFLFPSIRRVYIDDPHAPAFDKLKKRVKNLERERDTLVEQCERHMSNSMGHKKSERDAWKEVDRLEAQLQEQIEEQDDETRKLRKDNSRLVRDMAELEERYQSLRLENKCLEVAYEQSEENIAVLLQRVDTLKSRISQLTPLASKRKPIAPYFSEDEEDEVEHPSKRPTRPMPHRMRQRP